MSVKLAMLQQMAPDASKIALPRSTSLVTHQTSQNAQILGSATLCNTGQMVDQMNQDWVGGSEFHTERGNQ